MSNESSDVERLMEFARDKPLAECDEADFALAADWYEDRSQFAGARKVKDYAQALFGED